MQEKMEQVKQVTQKTKVSVIRELNISYGETISSLELLTENLEQKVNELYSHPSLQEDSNAEEGDSGVAFKEYSQLDLLEFKLERLRRLKYKLENLKEILIDII